MTKLSEDSSPRLFPSIVIATIVTAGIWLATVGIAAYRRPTNGIDVAKGAVTFRNRCGACHVVEKGVTTHHGPNLYDFGKRAGTRRPDLTAAEYVLESILEPDAFVHPDNHRGMPKSLASGMTPTELRNLIAYVVGRGSSPDFDEIASMDIPHMSLEVQHRVIDREDMAKAVSLLKGRGQCLECHSLFRNAEYTVLAPALFSIGLSDETLIRESIVDPNRDVSPYHRWSTVILVDGRVITGKKVAQSDNRIVLLQRGLDGKLDQIEIQTADIETEDGELLVVPTQTSPMPAGLDQVLTDAELDVLIRMIHQLN